MNEIKHIHLGRQEFTVALDAYRELKDYLHAISMASGGSATEVSAEVELRMAELLIERGCTKDSVVLQSDVAFLQAQLGDPREFSEEEVSPAVPHDEQSTTDQPKRLFRDSEHGMIAGVAAGLANYVGIDPIIVRILFVAFVFLGGGGVLIYILLWLLVPEAKTTSDKLTMQGKPVTVENLKSIVNQADVPGAARRATHIFARICRELANIVLLVLGILLAVGAGIGSIGLISVAGYTIFNPARVAGVTVFPIGSREIVTIVAVILAALLVAISLLLVGIAMIRRRWQLPAWGVATLIGLFFIATITAGILTPTVVSTVRTRVQNLHHQTDISLASFSSAQLVGHNRFIYIPDSRSFVRLRYLGTMQTKGIQLAVRNATLYADASSITDDTICSGFCINRGPDLQIEIHAPHLDSVSVSGSQANFISLQSLDQSSIDLQVAQSARATIENISPTSVEVTANSDQDRRVQLQFQPNTSTADGITINDDGTMALSALQAMVAITTNRQCVSPEGFVFIMNKPGQLTVNGITVNADPSRYGLDTSGQASAANCVVPN